MASLEVKSGIGDNGHHNDGVNPMGDATRVEVFVGEGQANSDPFYLDRYAIPHEEVPPPGTVDVLKPDPAEPSIAREGDFFTGRIEFGFDGKPADAVVVAAGGVANGGPTTQIMQNAEAARLMTEQTRTPVYFVGANSALPEFAKVGFTGEIPEFLQEVHMEGADTVADRYKAVEDAMTEAILKLAQTGNKNILFVSNGYTGFVPWGVKKGVEAARAAGYDVRAKLVIQDSSFPDKDNPSVELDENGYPVDRFYPPAYASTDNVDVYFAINNWLTQNPQKLIDRGLNGVIHMDTTFPFTPDYMSRWAEFRKITRAEARTRLATLVREEKNVPDMADMLDDPDVLFVPLIASDGYFDKSNIGKWMTDEQFQDMLDGSLTLVQALQIISGKSDKRVLLTGVKGFTDYVKSLGLDNVHSVSEQSDATKTGVFVGEAPMFGQDTYALYLKAGVPIMRTSQTNTMAEGILAAAGSVLLTMPAHRYMQADIMDARWGEEAGGRQYFYNVDPEVLARSIWELEDSSTGAQAALIHTQDNLIMNKYRRKGLSFFHIVSHVGGFRNAASPN